MKIKRIASLVLSFTLLLTLAPVTFAAGTKTTLAVGDIIQIGTYGEGDLCEPVEYKVMGKRDANGDGVEELFLASTKLVTFKAINAFGQAIWKGNTGNTDTPSDLRAWLNSDAASFTTGKNLKPNYEGTPGFMSTMKNYEKEQIVAANLKSLVYVAANNGAGADDRIGTSTGFSDFNAAWPQAWTAMQDSHSTLQHVETTDKVFIPSIEELYTFFGGDNITANINVELTKAAEAEADGDYAAQKETWLRDNTTTATNPVANRRIRAVSNSAGDKFVETHILDIRTALGVRPCMYLKADTQIERVSGEGVIYKIKKKLAVGEIIRIGTYGEGDLCEPVEYKVMGKRDANGDGVEEFFLASTKLVTFKAINAFGQAIWKGNTGSTDTPSDLRAWLNSDAASFTTGKGSKPDYEGTPGFMSTMSDYEKSQIVAANLKSLVYVAANNGAGADDRIGTSTGFSDFNAAWPQAWTAMQDSHSTLQHVETIDKVFIPSIEELYTFFGGDNITANINVELTKAAEAEADSSYSTVKQTWTRDNTTSATNPVANRRIYYENSKIKSHVLSIREALGVRPCMYLNVNANIELAPGSSDVYTLVEPSADTGASTYIDYAGTSDGTVIRATVYNDSDESKDYILIIAAFNPSTNVFDNAMLYPMTVGAGRENYVDSDVINCGSSLLYKAFLWEDTTYKPVVGVFPMDLSD